jgi:hypothetical protein
MAAFFRSQLSPRLFVIISCAQTQSQKLISQKLKINYLVNLKNNNIKNKKAMKWSFYNLL